MNTYRGRLAPTPTGYLHLGHAATFQSARDRARGGELLLRIEDLDTPRCKPEFISAALEDIQWLGLTWSGDALYQSTRQPAYLRAWRALRDAGWIYPCRRSRRDIAAQAPSAPHEEEPLFPTAWRTPTEEALAHDDPAGVNWRFRVPDHETITFTDRRLGPIERTTQRDFGDFLLWNRDGIPAYELAVVVDDRESRITEVVRGADLLTSTARQILLYRALGSAPPAFYHCPLLVDESGKRLAKRSASLSLRALRAQGWGPDDVLAEARRLQESAPDQATI